MRCLWSQGTIKSWLILGSLPVAVLLISDTNMENIIILIYYVIIQCQVHGLIGCLSVKSESRRSVSVGSQTQIPSFLETSKY